MKVEELELPPMLEDDPLPPSDEPWTPSWNNDDLPDEADVDKDPRWPND